MEDGKPRVTNVNSAAAKGMIKVGDWSQLEDPVGHEAEHVALAEIRKANPHLVCKTCDYFIVHKCPGDYNSNNSNGPKHCEECCQVKELLDPRHSAATRCAASHTSATSAKIPSTCISTVDVLTQLMAPNLVRNTVNPCDPIYVCRGGEEGEKKKG